MAAGESEKMRARLAAAGWSVVRVRENALVIKDVPMDVTKCTTTRGPLRADVVRRGLCAEADFVDHTTTFGPLVAVGWAGETRYHVKVADAARAFDELAALQGLFDPCTFEASIALVEARGFVVDRRASVEDEYDEFHRTIEARKAGEHMSLSYAYRGYGEPMGMSVCPSSGDAEMRQGSFTLTIRVWSLAAAEDLLGVLLASPAP